MHDGFQQVNFNAPKGREGEVGRCPAVIGIADGHPLVAILLEMSDDERQRAAEVGGLWLTLWADHLDPFSIEVADGYGGPEHDVDALQQVADAAADVAAAAFASGGSGAGSYVPTSMVDRLKATLAALGDD